MALDIVLCVSKTQLSLSVVTPCKHKSTICDSQGVHLSTNHLLDCACFKCIYTSCKIITTYIPALKVRYQNHVKYV